ncbi:ankyrin-3-like [Uloborus diversus]|uniref:ankyrin-3-like n=1 Tax=Uloborus diversus TaxID=327109 RepID=UPI00240A0CF5|nr:ankyrin-3-like [Uloborus diversus]
MSSSEKEPVPLEENATLKSILLAAGDQDPFVYQPFTAHEKKKNRNKSCSVVVVVASFLLPVPSSLLETTRITTTTTSKSYRTIRNTITTLDTNLSKRVADVSSLSVNGAAVAKEKRFRRKTLKTIINDNTDKIRSFVAFAASETAASGMLLVTSAASEHSSASSGQDITKQENIQPAIQPQPVNPSENWETTALHDAVDDRDLVAQEAAGGRIGTRAKGKTGLTPLHAAMMGKRQKEAEILVHARCITAIHDDDGYTPLQIALKRGIIGVMTELIAGGADTAQKDRQGRTFLHMALQHCEEAAAEMLAGGGHPRFERPRQSKANPLPWAGRNGYVQIARQLLVRNAIPHMDTHSEIYPLLLCG